MLSSGHQWYWCWNRGGWLSQDQILLLHVTNFLQRWRISKVSWLKNCSIFPPRLCVDIYICENSRTCILRSFDSDLTDWLVVLEALDVGSLFFFIGSSYGTLVENFHFTELVILFLSNFFYLLDGWYYIIPQSSLSTQLNKLIWFIWFKRVS